ncbi:MAG: MBL fold metallo-hydrolase [Cocleimonas sp.]
MKYSFIFTLILFSHTLVNAAGQVIPSACNSQRVQLQMLGTRGPELLDGQASTGYLILLDNKARVIVDAGPGSLQRFKQSKAHFEDVDVMLFSHFHADHSADFPSYIKGAFFIGRSKDLHVMGPSAGDYSTSAKQFVDRAISTDKGMYPYLGGFVDTKQSTSYKIKVKTIPWSFSDLNIKQIYHNDDINIKAVATHHGPFPSLGYRVELAGCSISFSGDMSGRLRAMQDLAKDSDILVAHNAIPEDAVGVPARLHMTPSYIGALANDAKVKNLLLTHLMKRSLSVKPQTLKLIKNKYKGKVSFPNDLDIIRP